jgi:hypothetical protein
MIRNGSKNIGPALGLFAMGFALLCPVHQAHAQILRTVDTRIEGLPGGLNVGMGAFVFSCPPGLAGFFKGVSSLPLTEQTYYTTEQTLTGIKIVLKSAYVGHTTLTLPADNGCGNPIPDDTVQFTYGIDGIQNNVPKLQITQGFAGVHASPTSFAENFTLKAATSSILENGSTPVTLAKNTFHHLLVEYDDSFGQAAIQGASLDFTQPGISFLGFPINVSRARMSLSSDRTQLCLAAAGITQCRNRSLGGTISVGNVTLDVANTSIINTNGGLDVIWNFRFESGFAAGDFNVIASADDADPFDYLVDGQDKVLDLLPWKSLVIPVSVTN